MNNIFGNNQSASPSSSPENQNRGYNEFPQTPALGGAAKTNFFPEDSGNASMIENQQQVDNPAGDTSLLGLDGNMMQEGEPAVGNQNMDSSFLNMNNPMQQEDAMNRSLLGLDGGMNTSLMDMNVAMQEAMPEQDMNSSIIDGNNNNISIIQPGQEMMNNSNMLSQPDEERKYAHQLIDDRKGSIFLNFDPKDLQVQDDLNQQMDFGSEVGIAEINKRQESMNRFDGADELLGIEQADKPEVIPEE